jgi:hypothetical protein
LVIILITKVKGEMLIHSSIKMKYFLISVAVIVFLLTFVSANGYVAPSMDNITIVLDQNYTVQPVDNIIIVLGQAAPPVTNCNPIVNADWIITDSQTCDAVNINIGTGNIYINSGNLTLSNCANVTANSIEIRTTGDRIFINKCSELIS